MVATPSKLDQSSQKVNGTGRRDSILTPRFYTTNFEAMAKMDIFDLKQDYEAILEEFKFDYNRRHFVRTADFNQSWDHIDPKVREHFRVFLKDLAPQNFQVFCFTKKLLSKSKTRTH